jgi:hypothetical protein
MPKPPVRLNLSHRRLDSVLAGSDEDLLERVGMAVGSVLDKVDEGKAALAQELFDLVGPAVDLECGITEPSVGISLGYLRASQLTVCRCTAKMISWVRWGWAHSLG